MATHKKTKPAPKAKPHAASHGELHYSKEKLLREYNHTFAMFMKVMAIGVGGAVAYFFGVIIYLGLFGHSHTDSYIHEFGSRIQYDYKGTKLPMYEDPSLATQAPASGKHE